MVAEVMAASSATRSLPCLGPPRGSGEEITQRHRDIAFAVQERLEEASLHLARLALNEARSRNLCVAGGVALNCKMTGVLHRSGIADRLFVQPLSYDAGSALGAAMLAAQDAGDDSRFAMEHLQYGPDTTMPRSKRYCGVIAFATGGAKTSPRRRRRSSQTER